MKLKALRGATLILLSVSLVVAWVGPSACKRRGEAGGRGDAADVASYQEAREKYEEDREPSRLSAEDRRIMQTAAKKLAEKMPAPGLEVGEKAPDFALPNAMGEEVRLSDRLADGPVVLTFYRGAWCPYCNLELHALQSSLPAFREHGAQLIAVTPQKPDRSKEQIKEAGYEFEILSDLDSTVAKDYELYFEVPPELNELYRQKFNLDLADYNGEGRYELPVPGTFVIDRKGVIRAAFADTDYKRRMEPADILRALKRMDNGSG